MEKRAEELNWVIAETSDSPEAQLIHQALRDHVSDQVGPSNRKDLTIAVRSLAGEVLGGLRGFSHWSWFYISHLWVAESGRSQGVGRQLIEKIETYAHEQNFAGLYVDTFDERAGAFYKRNGFTIMGEIPDFPPGGKRTFLIKTLT